MKIMVLLVFLFSFAASAALPNCGLSKPDVAQVSSQPGTLYAVRIALRNTYRNGEALTREIESELRLLTNAIEASNLNSRVTYDPASKKVTVAFSIAEVRTPRFDETKNVYRRSWGVEDLPDRDGRLIAEAPSVNLIDLSTSRRDIEIQARKMIYGLGPSESLH